jgi:hypothetical protein
MFWIQAARQTFEIAKADGTLSASEGWCILQDGKIINSICCSFICRDAYHHRDAAKYSSFFDVVQRISVTCYIAANILEGDNRPGADIRNAFHKANKTYGRT